MGWLLVLVAMAELVGVKAPAILQAMAPEEVSLTARALGQRHGLVQCSEAVTDLWACLMVMTTSPLAEVACTTVVPMQVAVVEGALVSAMMAVLECVTEELSVSDVEASVMAA